MKKKQKTWKLKAFNLPLNRYVSIQLKLCTFNIGAWKIEWKRIKRIAKLGRKVSKAMKIGLLHMTFMGHMTWTSIQAPTWDKNHSRWKVVICLMLS